MIRGAIKGHTDDGFLQRFQMMVYPDQQTEWRYVDQYPDKESKNAVYEIFNRIAEWNPEPEPDKDFFTLRFDDEAQAVFQEWMIENENRLRSPDIHPVMESHLKKYNSLVPSLALIIFIAETESITIDSRVNNSAICKAITWAEYLETHAERVFAIGLNANISKAKAILAKIQNGSIKDGFGTRDIIRSGWSGLTELEDVKEGLQVLFEHGYLKIKEEKNKNPTAGRPAERYLINPKIPVKA